MKPLRFRVGASVHDTKVEITAPNHAGKQQKKVWGRVPIMPKKMSSNLEQCVSAPSSRRLDERPKAQRDPSQCLHGMASGVIIVQLFPPFHERQVGFSVEHGASVCQVYPRRRFSQQEVIILERVGSFQLQTKTKIDMR